MKDKIKIRSEHTSSGLVNLAKVVMPVAKQLLGAQGFYMVDLLTNWQTIVGKNLASYALPIKLTFKQDERCNGCLSIITLSGAFAMEIKQKERMILNKINEFFGYEAVGKLKILQTAAVADFGVNKKPIENLQKNVVSADKENYITELIKDIQSPKLRLVLQNLGQAIVVEAENEGENLSGKNY